MPIQKKYWRKYNEIDGEICVNDLKVKGISLPADPDILDWNLIAFLGSMEEINGYYFSTLMFEFGEDKEKAKKFVEKFNEMLPLYEIREDTDHLPPKRIYFKPYFSTELGIIEKISKINGVILPEDSFNWIKKTTMWAGGYFYHKFHQQKKLVYLEYLAGLPREAEDKTSPLVENIKELKSFLNDFTSLSRDFYPLLSGLFVHSPLLSQKFNKKSKWKKIEMLSLLEGVFSNKEEATQRLESEQYNNKIIYEEDYNEIVDGTQRNVPKRVWELTEAYPFVNGYIIRFNEKSIKNAGDLEKKLYSIF